MRIVLRKIRMCFSNVRTCKHQSEFWNHPSSKPRSYIGYKSFPMHLSIFTYPGVWRRCQSSLLKYVWR